VADLEKEIWIDAPPEAIYPYLVQPELATAWMGDQSWNDPRPGGVFRLDIRGHVTSGEFVELDPPRRVVYTWGGKVRIRSIRQARRRSSSSSSRRTAARSCACAIRD
jgi:uncharacterized protein YndB with AHSA1/START domain